MTASIYRKNMKFFNQETRDQTPGARAETIRMVQQGNRLTRTTKFLDGYLQLAAGRRVVDFYFQSRPCPTITPSTESKHSIHQVPDLFPGLQIHTVTNQVTHALYNGIAQYQ